MCFYNNMFTELNSVPGYNNNIAFITSKLRDYINMPLIHLDCTGHYYNIYAFCHSQGLLRRMDYDVCSVSTCIYHKGLRLPLHFALYLNLKQTCSTCLIMFLY